MKVVAQFPWTAVKEASRMGFIVYDVFEWNVWKMKWVRLANTACGFGHERDAYHAARERSDEIQAMLDNNRTPPEPL